MFKLNNLSITNKILISPIIVILFLIILSIFCVNALNTNKDAFSEIVEVKFELYKVSSKFLSDVNDYNAVIYKVFNYVTNAYDDKDIYDQIDLIKVMRKDTIVNIENLKKLIIYNPEIKEYVENIEKDFNNYNLEVDDTMNDVMNITIDKLIASDKYYLEIKNQIKIIQKFADDENIKSFNHELKHINSTLNTLYTLITLTFLISIFIIFLIRNSIKKPLEEFQKGLLEFFKYLNLEKEESNLINIDSTDELGKMAKVINENIEKTKDGLQKDRLILNSAIECAQNAKKGLLNARIEGETSNPSLNELKDVINTMIAAIEENIKNAMNVLSLYTNYDYRTNIDTTSMEGDLKALCSDINNLGKSIIEMILENKQLSLILSSNAESLSINVENLTTAANNQAASLEETAAAIEEITSNMQNSSQHIIKMTTFANEVSDSVCKGQELASKTAKSMDEINEETNAIAQSITIIDQIAFQTNILSLNAAVEAATAGESGRGFAVVAAEVRNLASRSAEAAREIKDLVENATIKANDGKKISSEMIEGYEKLNTNIKNTLSLIENISTSSKEQFSAMEQINDTVTKLDFVTQQNALAASETNKVARDVNNIAEEVVKKNDNKRIDNE